MGVMSFALLLFHVLTVVAEGASFSLGLLKTLFRLIVRSNNVTARSSYQLHIGRVVAVSSVITFPFFSPQAMGCRAIDVVTFSNNTF